MGLISISYKISYLESKLSLSVRTLLEKQGLNLLAHAQQEHALPQGLQPYLLLDLLYPAVRHYLWLAHPLLQQAVVQSLVENYRLERFVAEQLTQELFAEVSRHLPPPQNAQFRDGAKNFLLYVFVLILNHTNTETLVEDLGLGTSLLQRFNTAAAYFNEFNSSTEHKVYFEQDQDAMIHQVFTQLSAYKSKHPWALDLLHLYYLLADAPPPWQPFFLAIQSCQDLCDFFLDLGVLGQSVGMTHDAAINWWQKRLEAKGSGGAKLLSSLDSLLLCLSQKGLLEVVAEKTNDGTSHLFLTELGGRLSALAFLSQVKGKKLVAMMSLQGMPAAWQVAVIGAEGLWTTEQIADFLLRGPALCAQGLELALAKVLQGSPPSSREKVLEHFHTSIVPIKRAALRRVLEALQVGR